MQYHFLLSCNNNSYPVFTTWKKRSLTQSALTSVLVLQSLRRLWFERPKWTLKVKNLNGNELSLLKAVSKLIINLAV